MHRAGSNPHDMQISDFLCDFCARVWDGTFAMVEGHRGSLICDKCLAVAYADVVHAGANHGPGLKCTMCLEERKDAQWRSPVRDEAVICLRCIKQSATQLEKEAESGWTRPQAPN